MSADRFQGPAPSASDDASISREQSLQRLAETADYVSQRALQLDEQVHEAEQIVLHLGALARQLRTLSSNTTLEATRMRMSGPLAEIARQMRRISQQISESNDQLGLALRSYDVAAGELRQAASILLGDAQVLRSGDLSEEMGTPPVTFIPNRVPRQPTLPPSQSLQPDMLRRRRGLLDHEPQDDR